MEKQYDAAVVGSGPNGLAAAITLAEAGLSVVVFEAKKQFGGGLTTEELTAPGFQHDVCAAVHPLAQASPFFQSLPLAEFGLEWVHSEFPLVHPLDGDAAVVMRREVAQTAAELGSDARTYQHLMDWLLPNADKIVGGVMQPILRPPRHPLVMARFGLMATQSSARFSRRFAGTPARALFAGMAGHSILPLNAAGTAGYGLLLSMLAHQVGWPVARAGSGSIAAALVAYLRSLGGELVSGHEIRDLRELPNTELVMLDVSPIGFLGLAGERLPSGYRRALTRYRHGPGVFKLDYALSGPVPWRVASARRTTTLHLGGSAEEIAVAEAEVALGQHPDRPFVLISQPSVVDPTRAPAGRHTLWAYCHVPAHSTVNMTDRIERQIERFAPGFRDLVVARHSLTAQEMAARNQNYLGGDINGGAANLWQVAKRPVLSPSPYRTPLPGVFLCSASTPPGGGVHGMAGRLAAQAALASRSQARPSHPQG